MLCHSSGRIEPKNQTSGGDGKWGERENEYSTVGANNKIWLGGRHV